jgi:hypothetical protein
MVESNSGGGGLFEVVNEPKMPLLRVLGIRFAKIWCRSSVVSFRDHQDAKDQLYGLYSSLPYIRSDRNVDNDCVSRTLHTDFTAGEYFCRIV